MYSAPSPTPSSSSTLHPLHSVAPISITSSSYEPPQSSSSSRAPSPTNLGVRSRKSTPSSSPFLSFSSPPPPPFRPNSSTTELDDDSADVTRPSLRKATKDALGLAGQGSSRRENDSKGKGKQSERTRAASEGLAASDQNKEREVVVHKVLKTDTIASVTLQYGITQQALRKANRLWATDPIHLRPTLLIPLDECNLPSSSFGLERIAREENGDITVWRREEVSTSPSKRAEKEGLSIAAGRSEREHRIVSPTARRLISTSSFETSPNPNSNPPPSTSDFLAIWDDTPASSSRPSLDSVRSSTSSLSSISKPSFSPQIPSHLGPYSSSTASLDLTPPLPPTQYHSKNYPNEPPALIPITPDYSSQASTSFSPAPSTSSLDTTPPSEAGSTTLSKRTLKVERLPASQLSFFPPPNPNNPTSSPRSSSSLSKPPPVPPKDGTQRKEAEDLFFGPLANTLASSFPSLRNLNKYLPTSFSSSNLSSYSSTGNGPIALPLSRTSSPHRTRTRTTSNRNSASTTTNWNGWNLDYFGGEEEQAAAALGSGFQDKRSSRSGTARKRNGNRAEVSRGDGERRTSEIGLEQVSSVNGLARTVDPGRDIWPEQGADLIDVKKKNTSRGEVRETFGLI
ncbi:hypothetical protein JCM3765_003020 [Sporobolomyces pararoseus]